MNIRQFRNRFNQERTTTHDINNVSAGTAQVPARVPINSSGEATATIHFPVKFTTQPYMSYGFELQEGEGTERGIFPTGSAYVVQWLKIERLPNTIFYTGAVVTAVVTGMKYQKTILNLSFTGTALTNPS